jgi:hypothetical protein
MLREDAWVIKFLCRHNPPFAKLWSESSIINICKWGDNKWSEGRIPRSEIGNELTGHRILNPMFDKFSIIYRPDIAILFINDPRQIKLRYPTSTDKQIQTEEPWVVCVAVKEGNYTWSRIFLLDNDVGKFYVKDQMDGRGQDGRGMAQVSVYALNYFTTTDKHLVKVFPTAKPTKREQKTAKLKPWLRTDYPRIILLDSTSAKQYGHGGNTDSGRTHASPRIHQRRGHWRTLLNERFKSDEDGAPRKIWVRPAWVGEREWNYAGNTYKVLQCDTVATNPSDAPPPNPHRAEVLNTLSPIKVR